MPPCVCPFRIAGDEWNWEMYLDWRAGFSSVLVAGGGILRSALVAIVS